MAKHADGNQRGGKPTLRKLETVKNDAKPAPSVKNKPRIRPLVETKKPPKSPIKTKGKTPFPSPEKEPVKAPVSSTSNTVMDAISRGSRKPNSAKPDPDAPVEFTPESLAANPFAQFIERGKVSLGGRKPGIMQLTQETYGKLLLLIQHGAYDYQAAQALGIAYHTFWQWMQRGIADKENNRLTAYTKFYQDVSQSSAMARTLKEIEVAHDNPEFWLRSGPGKTRKGMPGWTDSLKLESGDDPLQIEVTHKGGIDVSGEVQTTHLVVDKSTPGGLLQIAEALAHLQAAGIDLTTGKTTQAALPASSKPVEPSTNGNGHTNGHSSNGNGNGKNYGGHPNT